MLIAPLAFLAGSLTIQYLQLRQGLQRDCVTLEKSQPNVLRVSRMQILSFATSITILKTAILAYNKGLGHASNEDQR
jgi:hypothetical protein